jgi:hypothetical protein
VVPRDANDRERDPRLPGAQLELRAAGFVDLGVGAGTVMVTICGGGGAR